MRLRSSGSSGLAHDGTGTRGGSGGIERGAGRTRRDGAWIVAARGTRAGRAGRAGRLLAERRTDEMGEQQGVRQGSDSSGNRGDRGCHGPGGFEVDIADDRAVDDVDPDVDDDHPAAEHVATDEARPTRGDDEDFGVLDLAREVTSP